MTYENNETYQILLNNWKAAKQQEESAKESRLKAERAILEIVGVDLREKGINHLDGGIDITTGMDEKYEEDEVSRLFNRFKEGLLPALPFFPFKQVWQADSKKIAVLKEDLPEVFKQTFKDALTIKPKKPSFSLKKEK